MRELVLGDQREMALELDRCDWPRFELGFADGFGLDFGEDG